MLEKSDKIFTEADKNRDKKLSNDELREELKTLRARTEMGRPSTQGCDDDRIHHQEERVLYSVVRKAIEDLNNRDPESTIDISKWRESVNKFL